MTTRILIVVILLMVAAPALRAAELHSLLPAASRGTSLHGSGGTILVLGQAAGRTGGAALFRYRGSALKPLTTFDYGQRSATAVSDPDSPVTMIGTVDGGYALLVDVKGYSAQRDGTRRLNAIWLIKVTAGGAHQWAEMFADPGLGYKPFHLMETADGGYLITGSTMAGTVWNSLVIKTDARGALSWKKSLPSTSFASFREAVQLTDGGYFLYGYDRVQDRVNYWLVRTDAQGAQTWQKTWPGMGDFLPRPLVRGPGGSFFGMVKSENQAPRLLAFGSAGTPTLEWTLAGMQRPDMVNDWLLLPDGSHVFCGWTQNATQDILLAKIGPGNRLLWRKTIHLEGDDLGMRVLRTTGGGFLLITTTGYSYDYKTQRYSYKTTLVKCDDSGNRLWAESFSIGTGDHIDDALIMPDGRCAMLITCIRNAKQEALLLVTEPGGKVGTIREER